MGYAGRGLGEGVEWEFRRPHTHAHSEQADVNQVEEERQKESGSSREGKVLHVTIADLFARHFGGTELLRVVHDGIHDKGRPEHRVPSHWCEVEQAQHV